MSVLVAGWFSFEQMGATAGDLVLRALVDRHEMAVVPIDTRLDENATGLRSAAEVEALIARMDAVLTTRLHGTVFALKSGVPALAIDPIAGGAKIFRQARTLGWSAIFTADDLDAAKLDAAYHHCLTPAARAEAAAYRDRARDMLADVKGQLLDAAGNR